ncbi:hypothetical protein ACFQL3_11770 [Natronoarchaeum sp. GCM10025321]|uniref:DUF7261 family protein n=1 Tax=Natronoarchaeum sp. GCM10025321 TaxID=3252684 RepID=UPI003616DDAB
MSDDATGTRGQLVLLAAAVIAFALATGALAYLQVGTHPDVEQRIDDGSPDRVVNALERSVHDAASPIPAAYDWDEREAAAAAIEDSLEPRIETLRVSELEHSVVHDISYDESAAATWADENCPGGPDRQFGECEALGGVVVQERAGETHVLGVAIRIRTTTDRTQRETTVRVTDRG